MQSTMSHLETTADPTPNDGKIVLRLAHLMRFVGVFLVIFGLVSIGLGVQAAMAKHWWPAAQLGGPGIMWVSLGIRAVRGSSAFKSAAKTQARADMMRGLDQMTRFFLTLAIFAAIFVAIFAAGVVSQLFQST